MPSHSQPPHFYFVELLVKTHILQNFECKITWVLTMRFLQYQSGNMKPAFYDCCTTPYGNKHQETPLVILHICFVSDEF